MKFGEFLEAVFGPDACKHTFAFDGVEPSGRVGYTRYNEYGESVTAGVTPADVDAALATIYEDRFERLTHPKPKPTENTTMDLDTLREASLLAEQYRVTTAMLQQFEAGTDLTLSFFLDEDDVVVPEGWSSRPPPGTPAELIEGDDDDDEQEEEGDDDDYDYEEDDGTFLTVGLLPQVRAQVQMVLEHQRGLLAQRLTELGVQVEQPQTDA